MFKTVPVLLLCDYYISIVADQIPVFGKKILENDHEMCISAKNHHIGQKPKGVPFGFCPFEKSVKEGFNLHILARNTTLNFASTKGIFLRFGAPKNHFFGRFWQSQTSQAGTWKCPKVVFKIHPFPHLPPILVDTLRLRKRDRQKLKRACEKYRENFETILQHFKTASNKNILPRIPY